ncbi:MAG: hypothetical protein ABID63_10820 [Pseudomonadota bacterium]
MGSLFSGPKPQPVASAIPVVVSPPDDPAQSAVEAARQARLEAQRRRSYGRAGLIATGYRGLLQPGAVTAVATGAAATGGGKSLLGE